MRRTLGWLTSLALLAAASFGLAPVHGARAAGGTQVCGTLGPNNYTWNAAGAPYYICPSGVIAGMGTKLTLDGAGGPFSVIAQGAEGLRSNIGGRILTANTGPNAVVTFDGPQAIAGSWRGITSFESDLSLSYVTILHAIHAIHGLGGEQWSQHLDHLTISDTLADGIRSDEALTLTFSTIARTGGDGVQASSGSITDTQVDQAAHVGIDFLGGFPTVLRNVVTNSGTGSPHFPAMFVSSDLTLGPGQRVDANTGAGNGIDAIALSGTTTGFTWISPTDSSVVHPLGYVVYRSLTSAPNATFTFPANAVVKLGGGPMGQVTGTGSGAFVMGSGATFDASAGGLRMTSMTDDAVAPSTCGSSLAVSCSPRVGDLGGIQLTDKATANLTAANITYADRAVSASAAGAVEHITLTGSTIRHAGTGVTINGAAVINVSGSTFDDIAGTAVEGQPYPSTGSGITVTGSTFTNVTKAIEYIQYPGSGVMSITGNHVNGAGTAGFLLKGLNPVVQNNDFTNTDLPLAVEGTMSLGPGGTVSANTGSGNTADIMEIAGDVTTSFTWVSPAVNSAGQGLGYVMTGNSLAVDPGATLTIPANAVVRGTQLVMNGSTLDASAGGATFTVPSDTTVGVPVSPPLRGWDGLPADSSYGLGVRLESMSGLSGSAVVVGAVMRGDWGVHLESGATTTAGGRTAGLVMTGTRVDTHYGGRTFSYGTGPASAISVTRGTATLDCDRLEHNSGGLLVTQPGSAITRSDLETNSSPQGYVPSYFDLDAGAAVDATNNWWGQSSGPGPGQVNHPTNAVTSPYLSSPSACAPPAEPAAAQVTVWPSTVRAGAAHSTTTVRRDLTIANPGTAALRIQSLTLSANPNFRVLNSCDNTIVNAGQYCIGEVDFVPVSGGHQTAQLTIRTDLGTFVRPVVGDADASQSPTLVLPDLMDLGPYYTGSPVSLNATISGAPRGNPMPTGTLTINEGSAVLAGSAINSDYAVGGGSVAFQVPGRHVVTMRYSGDAFFAPSTSAPITVVVVPPPPPPPLAGGVGTDRALWVAQPGGLHSLGGVLLGVAMQYTTHSDGTSDALYIGTGTDHDLWIRGDSAGWQRFNADGRVYCIDSPAAALVGGPGAEVLNVACEGGDHRLWAVQVLVAYDGTLPVAHTVQWHSLGGTLAAGPAVGRMPTGEAYFLAVGTDRVVYGRRWNDAGFTSLGWSCVGHPALAWDAFKHTIFACHGLDGQGWVAVYQAGAWSNPFAIGGKLVDGVGIAARPTEVRVFVEGTDGALWSHRLGVGWSKVGGTFQYGAAAG